MRIQFNACMLHKTTRVMVETPLSLIYRDYKEEKKKNCHDQRAMTHLAFEILYRNFAHVPPNTSHLSPLTVHYIFFRLRVFRFLGET